MANSLNINVAGVWKTVDVPWINVGGVWKTPDKVSINVGGVWKEVWISGPSVSPATNGDYNFRASGTCYAGVQFNSNGIEYEYTNTGGTTSLGNWLDSGLNSEVWVERIITVGSFNSIDAGSGRLQLSTTRSFRVQRSVNGSFVCTATFNFYDAASGGNLLATTGSITFEAEQGTA